MKKILTQFGVTPTREAFANAKNARFDKWWGPDSKEGEDAFQQEWGKEILWMNPRFDVFPQVLEKSKKDQAHAILVVPGWRRREFFHRAREMALYSVVFPETL